MAINIFSGSANSGKKKANQASNSIRTKEVKSALASVAPEASSSGSTAVGSKGSLAKIGNTVGKIAGVASKFLPGLGGTIAGAVSNLLNDPEWWQSVPGDALTLNEPLRAILVDQLASDGSAAEGTNAYSFRSAILEFLPPYPMGVSTTNPTQTVANLAAGIVITPTERMITQYLMPEIRKVVNAIPLQDAQYYNKALRTNAAIYALWRELLKIDYMCKHGQTYLANMNDTAFPLFQTQNAAWLQATIRRLEEYLRANVRLPHTLCEYLAWRFGRVYKSNNSKKAALVLYNAIPLSYGTVVWDAVIGDLMDNIAGNPNVQRANTDLFNTYYDHDYLVEVRDDTQFTFDMKEFMLRLNLNGTVVDSSASFPTVYAVQRRSLVAIDSALDNPTAFMASTVSALGKETSGGNAYETLFPVSVQANVYIPFPESSQGAVYYDAPAGTPLLVNRSLSEKLGSGAQAGKVVNDQVSSLWRTGFIFMDEAPSTEDDDNHYSLLNKLILSKAVDLYNFGAYVHMTGNYYLDVSALSIDAGSPTSTVLNTEHVYAFANLVAIDRKHSMSYKQAEHQVARDTADLVEKLDIATKA